MPERTTKIMKCPCGREFVFSQGEQKYYEYKGLAPPKHCEKCRKERKKFFAEKTLAMV